MDFFKVFVQHLQNPKCDSCYVELQYQNTIFKTNNTNYKIWNEEFIFLLNTGILDRDPLFISLYESEGKKEKLSQNEIILKDAMGSKISADFSVPMNSINKANQLLGILKIQVTINEVFNNSNFGQESNKSNNIVSIDPTQNKNDLSRHQDFQIRVKIGEARQLIGTGIKALVKVQCWHKSGETSVAGVGNSPTFNQSLNFDFYTSPSILCNEIISFTILNSCFLRTNMPIGLFKMDLGMVYDSPDHAIINKWLLLSDPDDPNGGAKGYLKVSVCIVCSGGEVPDMDTKPDSANVDIEKNVLRPVGVQLRPAAYVLRLFKGEDFPPMDVESIAAGIYNFLSSGKNESCDPFVAFSFAGNEVKSSVKQAALLPEWNEELKLALQFPSMCEIIKLQCMDWERISNPRPIATHIIKTSFISSGGSSSSKNDQGFLPCFGPCFIPLYGCPREFEGVDLFQMMNLGMIEGSSYRGRLLVELSTVMEKSPKDGVQPLAVEHTDRIQKFLRRRKFHLYVVFNQAVMVASKDKPVEFEVSIGNYGSKLYLGALPNSSTTPPTNPVFDGCCYHFLPWGAQKPCTLVESHWEDISYRMYSANFFIRMADRLETAILKAKIADKGGLPNEDPKQLIDKAINDLILQCNLEIPIWDNTQNPPTELDINIRKVRVKELTAIKEKVKSIKEKDKGKIDVQDCIVKLEEILKTIHSLGRETQMSIPDVMIWMLNNNQRVAYFRIPAYEIFYSTNEDLMGRYCGVSQNINLKPLVRTIDSEPWQIQAHLRLKMWFGFEKDEAQWYNMQAESTLGVFAEAYEHQVLSDGKWTTTGPLMTRPAWSDASGMVELNINDMKAPLGWQWQGEWVQSPEMSVKIADRNPSKDFVDECFVNEVREKGKPWTPAPKPFTKENGQPNPQMDQIPLKKNWVIISDWAVDKNRSCDEDGWEYASDDKAGAFVPIMKEYHTARRRRFIRTTAPPASEQGLKAIDDGENWEYATSFTHLFHCHAVASDLVRRRRYHRLMKSNTPNAAPFFTIGSGKLDDETAIKTLKATVPRLYLNFKQPHFWELRAYVYQARNLRSANDSNLSNPFAVIAFANKSQKTAKKMKTLCPSWNQTLIFQKLELFSDPEDILKNPPCVSVELYSYNSMQDDEFIGRRQILPVVKLKPQSDNIKPVLQWIDLKLYDCDAGEILCSFELFLVDKTEPPPLPPKQGAAYTLPDSVKPSVEKVGIEILAWGVRNLQPFERSAICQPQIEYEINGVTLETDIIKNIKEYPNFRTNTLFTETHLPNEPLYLPPINIKLFDNRNFGRKPLVGIHVLKSWQNYRVEPIFPDPSAKRTADEIKSVASTNLKASPKGKPADVKSKGKAEKKAAGKEVAQKSQNNAGYYLRRIIGIQENQNAAKNAANGQSETSIEIEEQPSKGLEIVPAEDVAKYDQSNDKDNSVDWWSKYYASLGDDEKCMNYKSLGYDLIQYFPNELEKAPEYNNFHDLFTTFTLVRGKSDLAGEECPFAGEYKGNFRVYRMSENPEDPKPKKLLRCPSSAPQECLIRVYIVKVIDLQAKDSSGLADSYIKCIVGSKSVNNCDTYIPNSVNPIFGRHFEINAIIPLAKDLIIQVMDHSMIDSDEVLGETKIDLENRLYTKFRATCGIAQTYSVSGPCVWRDGQTPEEILLSYARENGIRPPVYSQDNVTVSFNGKQFNLLELEANKNKNIHWGPPKQRLACLVLNSLPLVREHVETRNLYSNLQPGISQGKIHLWVDIFPTSKGKPGPPVDIAIRKPIPYVLRVVVWNTKDVILESRSFNGEKMSDIYVQGWMSGIDERQQTDVHYRSLDGEGNFNWRFVFPFDFVPSENLMSVKKKRYFWSLDATEQLLPCKVIIQIWDNDLFSAGDFLGLLELTLSCMPAPCKKAAECTIDKLPTYNPKCKVINLFECRRAYGFWPCYNDDKGSMKGNPVITGKVEMELELLTINEAEKKPAGAGRGSPNQNPFLEDPKRPDTSFIWFTSPWKTFRFLIWKNYKYYFIGVFVIMVVFVLIIVFIYSVPGATVSQMLGV